MEIRDHAETVSEDKQSNSKVDKYCAACGARLPATAKFCSECGYGINGENSEYADAHVKSENIKAIRRLTVAPSILFAVFGLLLFVLYAAPVVGTMGIGLDVYALCSDINKPIITAMMIMLVVLAVAVFITAAVTCYYKFWLTVNSSDAKAVENSDMEVLPVVFYSLYIVIGIVMSVVVIAVFKSPPAAGPVLFTVFSIAFIITHCTVTKYKKKLCVDFALSDNVHSGIAQQSSADWSESGQQVKEISVKKQTNIKQYFPHIFFAVTIFLILLVGALIPAYRGQYFDYEDNWVLNIISIVFFDITSYDGPFVADCLYICNWIVIAASVCAVIMEIIALVWTLKYKDGGKIARRTLLAFGIIYFLLSAVTFTIILSDYRFLMGIGLPVVFVAACFCTISAAVLIAKNKKKSNAAGE